MRTKPRVPLRCPSRTSAMDSARSPSSEGIWLPVAELLLGEAGPAVIESFTRFLFSATRLRFEAGTAEVVAEIVAEVIAETNPSNLLLGAVGRNPSRALDS